MLLGGAALLLELLLPPGSPFLVGPWRARLAMRLPHATGILTAMGRELLAPDWLGFWIAFPGAAFFAWRRRIVPAMGLLAAVAVQTAPYFFIYAATYLSPLRHIEASYFRLMSALLPITAVAYGMVLAGREAEGGPAAVDPVRDSGCTRQPS